MYDRRQYGYFMTENMLSTHTVREITWLLAKTMLIIINNICMTFTMN